MNFLFISSLLIALFALVKSTLERRGPNRIPILVLIRDRFPIPQWKEILIGVGIGSFLVIGPLGLSIGLDWAQLGTNGLIRDGVFLLAIMTIGLKFVWAAIEELIFRGAVLPQSAKVSNGLVGLIVSSLLFAWGHLERSGANTPDGLSLLVFGLDGIGFGIAYLATRNLWLPTIWHTAKNIWIWILFGQSTLQLTPGFFQVTFTGPVLWVGMPKQAGLLDLMASFVAAAVVLVVYRREFAAGLAWVKNQNSWRNGVGSGG